MGEKKKIGSTIVFRIPILKIYYLDIAISFHTFSSEQVEETAMENLPSPSLT